jgi:hypothetical protein
MRPVRNLAAAIALTANETIRWRKLVATVLVTAVVALGPHPYQGSTAERRTIRPFRWSCGSKSHKG